MNIHTLLSDIIAHTRQLGFMSEVKIIGNTEETVLVSVADDRTVVLEGIFKQVETSFSGVFSMSKLDNLNHHLKNPEYKENAKINITREVRGGEDTPVGISFENASGDFRNTYRFSVKTTSDSKRIRSLIKDWEITVKPDQTAIQRFKLQASANSEYKTCQISTSNGNLVVNFGCESTHAGSFVFSSAISGELKYQRTYPVAQILAILSIQGEKTVEISDVGAIRISVSSDLVDYQYTIRANS